MNLSKSLRRLSALLACASAFLISMPAAGSPAVAAPLPLSAVDPYARPDSALLVRLPGDMLTRAQACYDLDALMNALRQIHPDIFSAAGHEKIVRRYQDIRRAFPDTLSTAGFYQSVAPLVSMIGDPNTVLLSSAPQTTAPVDSLSDAPWTYYVDPVFHTAVMNFRNFSGTPRQMSHFCDSMFSALRIDGISHLVIDVRGNTGSGDPQIADVLLRYISPVPFIRIQKELVNRSPMVLALTASTDTLPSISFREVAQSDFIPPLTPAEGHFDGRVALITDSLTSSSAASLAWAFSHFCMGPVVGKETGGRNICFGDTLTWYTPVGRIPCAISHKRFWYPGANEFDIHGTIPDIETLRSDDPIDYVWSALMGLVHEAIGNTEEFVTLQLLDTSHGALGRITDAVYHAPQGDTKVRILDSSDDEDGIHYKFFFDPNTSFNREIEFTLYIDGRKVHYYRPFR